MDVPIQSIAPRPRSKGIFFAPFVGIALLLGCLGVVVGKRVSQLRSATADTVEDAMTDVLLMGRMRRDLDNVHHLVSEHIYEESASGMAALDANIASTQADFEQAATEFGSLPLEPEEEAPWRDLREEIGRIKPVLASALALSRSNDNAAARQQLGELADDFRRAADDLRAVSDINTRNAEATVSRARALERSAEAYLAVLAAGGAALALAVGSS